MTHPERAQKRLQHLRTLWTGDRPDGSRVRGEHGLTYEQHQELTNLLIEEVERIKAEVTRLRDQRDDIIDQLNFYIGEIKPLAKRCEKLQTGLSQAIERLGWYDSPAAEKFESEFLK